MDHTPNQSSKMAEMACYTVLFEQIRNMIPKQLRSSFKTNQVHPLNQTHPSTNPTFCAQSTLSLVKICLNFIESDLNKSKFFSSPEPKAPGELLVWEVSVVRPSSGVGPVVSNDFSYETTGPNVTKFHM